MSSELTAKSLFNNYIKALKGQANGITISKLTPDLYLRDWNLYFFSKHGIDKYGYDVYCNKFNRRKTILEDLGAHFIGSEFLWDLCWFQRKEKVGKRGDFLELALEQECSQDFNDVSDAFWDFTKIIFACVKSMRVFIGRSSKERFEKISKECADYYAKTTCCKQNKGLLQILINQTSSGDTTICGWELAQTGEAKLLTEPVHFQYSGWF